LCKNIIISNSSFGWWAAYLSKVEHSNVFVPSVWFGKKLVNQGFNINDLILPNWNKIEVVL
jgi:hypothetical protein